MEKLNYYVGKKIVYVDVERTANKNMYLKVRGNDIVVSANERVPLKTIDGFVSEHIVKFVKYIDDAKAAELYSVQDEFIWLKGKRYSFSTLTGFKKNRLVLKSNKVYIETKTGEDAEIEKAIKEYLKGYLFKYIEKISPKFEKIMNIPHHEFRVVYKTRTWGTNMISKRSISYSSRLAHYPENIIDYVVVHELAHYYEPNHQSKFWDIVASVLPDYKARRKQLRADQSMIEE